MNRLTVKIIAIVWAALIGLNLMSAAALAFEPCPPEMCCGGPGHMDHCGVGMLNFSLPLHGCCGACTDLFCGLMNNPLPQKTALNLSPEQGYYYPYHLGYAYFIDEHTIKALPPKPNRPIPIRLASDLIPLYIEHLSLII